MNDPVAETHGPRPGDYHRGKNLAALVGYVCIGLITIGLLPDEYRLPGFFFWAGNFVVAVLGLALFLVFVANPRTEKGQINLRFLFGAVALIALLLANWRWFLVSAGGEGVRMDSKETFLLVGWSLMQVGISVPSILLLFNSIVWVGVWLVRQSWARPMVRFVCRTLLGIPPQRSELKTDWPFY